MQMVRIVPFGTRREQIPVGFDSGIPAAVGPEECTTRNADPVSNVCD
jgi:hypothetical protein